MNPKTYKEHIESQILSIIHELVQKGQMETTRAMGIAQVVLKTLKETQSLEEMQQVAQNWKEGLPELSSIHIFPDTKEDLSPQANSSNIKKPKDMFLQTQHTLERLEDILQSRIIIYYGPMHSDSTKVFYDHLERIGKQRQLILINNTYGEDIYSTTKLIALLRSYCDRLTIIVPSVGSNASTVLSLGADEIWMTPLASLSPIIPSIRAGLFSSADKRGNTDTLPIDLIEKIIELLQQDQSAGGSETVYSRLFQYFDPLTIAHADRTKQEIGKDALINMRTNTHNYNSEERMQEIIQKLITSYPSSYPIFFEEAKSIGLPVTLIDTSISYTLYKLINLYNAMHQAAQTTINLDLSYTGSYDTAVESVGLRTAFFLSQYKRYNSISRRREDLETNTSWVCFTPKREDPSGHTCTPLDEYGYTE